MTCPAFEADFTTKFYFPWDFHGNFHVGSKATLKCLPGYVLPKQFKCNADKCGGPYHPCLQLGQTGNIFELFYGTKDACKIFENVMSQFYIFARRRLQSF